MLERCVMLGIVSLILAAPAGAAPFTNPIVASGADPWVLSWQDAYYYCYSGGGGICIRKAALLPEIGNAPPVKVWAPPAGTEYSREIWAPELHYLDGRWYIYFAADDGRNANHRMYVLAGDTQDPQGTYTFRGKIAAPTDRWAIDGTVLTLADGSRYFIWSGWEGGENIRQDLYIAPMDTPWHISGERACLSTPEYDWEKIGRPLVNEGPEVLQRDGKIHIIYSASGSWTDDYCLGQLTYTGGDILKKESWAKQPTPVFSRTAGVFGPGHASFVRSPDGVDWIIYHAAKRRGAGWNRDVRMQPFTWNHDGSPRFGAPISPGVPLPSP